MKDLKEYLNESIITESRENGKCIWEVSNRAESHEIHSDTFEAKDLYEVLYKVIVNTPIKHSLFDHNLDDENDKYYVSPEASQSERDKVAKQLLKDLTQYIEDAGEDWMIDQIIWKNKKYFDMMNGLSVDDYISQLEDEGEDVEYDENVWK